jgi:hypothetical protein
VPILAQEHPDDEVALAGSAPARRTEFVDELTRGRDGHGLRGE